MVKKNQSFYVTYDTTWIVTLYKLEDEENKIVITDSCINSKKGWKLLSFPFTNFLRLRQSWSADSELQSYQSPRSGHVQ